jgi:hypothetical protein
MRARRRPGLGSLPWFAIGTDLAMRGVEMQMAIGERIAVLTVGGQKARKEARRMVTEKVLAAGEAVTTITMGGKPRKVQANHRWLSKG